MSDIIIADITGCGFTGLQSETFNLRFSVMLLPQTDWNSSIFSICHRILVAVPLICIKVETPAVGTVQYFDQSQAFSAASVAADL